MCARTKSIKKTCTGCGKVRRKTGGESLSEARRKILKKFCFGGSGWTPEEKLAMKDLFSGPTFAGVDWPRKRRRQIKNMEGGKLTPKEKLLAIFGGPAAWIYLSKKKKEEAALQQALQQAMNNQIPSSSDIPPSAIDMPFYDPELEQELNKSSSKTKTPTRVKRPSTTK